MFGIIINKDDSVAVVRRVISAVNHPNIQKLQIRQEDKARKNLSEDLTHVLLVGTEMIKKYLGAGVPGRNSAIFHEGRWYFTLPNATALVIKDVMTKAAFQILRACNAFDNPEFKLPEVPYFVLETKEHLRQFVAEALKSPFISFDFETNNMLQPRHPDFRVTVLSVTVTPGFAYMVPDYLFYTDVSAGVIDLETQEIVRPLFTGNHIKVAHNIDFDSRVLRHLGIRLKLPYWCTKIMARKIDENESAGLKECIDRYIPEYSGYDYGVSFSTGFTLALCKYAAIDTHGTLLLFFHFFKILSGDPKLYTNMRNLAMPASEVLVDMQYNGCYVDVNYLEDQITKIKSIISRRWKEIQDMPDIQAFVIRYNEAETAKAINDLQAKIDARLGRESGKKQIAIQAKISEAEAKLLTLKAQEIIKKADEKRITTLEERIANFKLAIEQPKEDAFVSNWQSMIENLRTGQTTLVEEVDLNSTKVLNLLFYTELGLGLPIPLKAEGREMVEKMSTDAQALDDIDHPVAMKLRELRTIQKMLSTYYESIKELSIEGKLYPGFNQTGTVTGRLCVAGDTMVLTRKGLVDIKSIVNGKQKLKVLTHSKRYRPIVNWWNKGEEQMYRVETNSNKEIKCTLAHIFQTVKGWQPLSALTAGDLLMTWNGYTYTSSPITSIQPVGIETVYDIEVSDDHSYVGNGIVNHNSSQNPNLQNLPSRVKFDDEEVAEIVKGVKKAFKAPEGYVVMQADLSQAELRVIASLSEDENMINAYLEGKDLHAITGSRIVGMQDDFEAFLKSEKFKPARTIAKSANFGLVYKISPKGYIQYIKAQTGRVISPSEEKVHRASVFGAYPNLSKWHERYEGLVKKYGYVRTLFGTKRNLPEIFSRDERKQGDAIRYAINSPVQGTIGEYALWLMIWLKHRLPSSVSMWLTVHDSVVLYVPTHLVEEVSAIIKETEADIPFGQYFYGEFLKVPLKVDIEIGPKYGEFIA